MLKVNNKETRRSAIDVVLLSLLLTHFLLTHWDTFIVKSIYCKSFN